MEGVRVFHQIRHLIILLDSLSGKTLNFCVVHVGAVKNSSRMELQGMNKFIEDFENQQKKINTITTDRHPHIKSFILQKKGKTSTCNCIFAMLIKTQKNLREKAEQSDWTILNGWIKSFVNHFWWSYASCTGDAIELKEKWLSLLCHIVKISAVLATPTRWLTHGESSRLGVMRLNNLTMY